MNRTFPSSFFILFNFYFSCVISYGQLQGASFIYSVPLKALIKTSRIQHLCFSVFFPFSLCILAARRRVNVRCFSNAFAFTCRQGGTGQRDSCYLFHTLSLLFCVVQEKQYVVYSTLISPGTTSLYFLQSITIILCSHMLKADGKNQIIVLGGSPHVAIIKRA